MKLSCPCIASLKFTCHWAPWVSIWAAPSPAAGTPHPSAFCLDLGSSNVRALSPGVVKPQQDSKTSFQPQCSHPTEGLALWGVQWGGAQVWTLQVWTFHVWTVTGTLWGERRPPPPSGRAPHPVLSAQMEGNVTPQPTCRSPRALVTCRWPERDRACMEMGVASASQSTESPDLRHPVPDVHVARPHQTHRGALPGARPSPPHTDPPARPPPQAGTYPNWEPAPTVL